MAQSVTVTPIIGLPTYSGWSQVVVARTLTNITAVIAVAIEGEGAATIGENLVSVIETDPPRSPEALYHLFEETVLQLAEYGCTCSLSGGVFRQGRSIIAAYNGAVVLKRDRKIAPVLTTDMRLHLVQGRSQLDDVYVFVTDQAREFVSTISLTFEKGYDTDSVVMALVPAIHSLENSSKSALGFAQVIDENSQEDEADVTAVPADEYQEVGALAASDVEQVSTEPEPEYTEALDRADEAVIPEDQSNSNQQGVESFTPPSAVPPPVEARPIREQIQSMIQPIGSGLKRSVLVLWPVIQAALRGLWRFFAAATLFVRKLISPADYVEYERIRKMRLIALIIGVLVVISVTAWLVVRWQSARQQALAAEVVAPYQLRLDEIRALADRDVIGARDEAQVVLKELVSLQVSAEDSNDAALLSAVQATLLEYEELATAISGREELAELPIALDLRTIRSDFLASHIVAGESLMFIVDQAEQQGMIFNQQTGENSLVDLSALGQLKSLTLRDENTAVLLADGISELTLEAGATPREVIAQGDSNRNATLVGTFGTFIYALNPEKRNIYRYSQGSEGYSAPIGWLTGPLGISFEELSSWAIDGDIWVTTQDGRVRKYTTGRQAEFEISGLEQAFAGRLQIVTSSTLDELYILEPGKQRVVILNKNGQFLRQITHVSLATATGFAISQPAQTAYIASGSLIFSLPLVY